MHAWIIIINLKKTHASVARLLRFNPLLPLKLLSFDRKMSLCASVGLCNNSTTELSFVRTYCNADCLLTRAILLISRCNSGKWERRNGKTFGRNGKFVASWTATWNSSMERPPLYKTHILHTCAYYIQWMCNLQRAIARESAVDRRHLDLCLVRIAPEPPEIALSWASAEYHEQMPHLWDVWQWQMRA
jgi:hypothetical protein